MPSVINWDSLYVSQTPYHHLHLYCLLLFFLNQFSLPLICYMIFTDLQNSVQTRQIVIMHNFTCLKHGEEAFLIRRELLHHSTVDLIKMVLTNIMSLKIIIKMTLNLVNLPWGDRFVSEGHWSMNEVLVCGRLVGFDVKCCFYGGLSPHTYLYKLAYFFLKR